MTAPFVSSALAARIDRAETQLTRIPVQVLLAEPAPSAAFIEEIAGGVAVYVAPCSPLNKLVGLGFAGLPRDEQLAAIEQKFQQRGAPLQAEVSTLVDGACFEYLARRGYILHGHENVLGRALNDGDRLSAPRAPGIEVRPALAEELPLWIETDVTASLSPDEQGVAPDLPARAPLLETMQLFARAPGFQRYIARIDGEIAGVAALRLDAGIAQLCGAATLPRFRRRGVQTRLLQQRLADAREAGAELAVMTTQPGSKSQQNAHRVGFSLLYCRANLVLQPASDRQR
jgi:ribosomal protein S18 acetylase RimI-like enzyme